MTGKPISRKNSLQIRILFIFLSLTVGMIYQGCATTDLLGNFNIISPQEEQQLGDQLAQSIAQQKKIVQDPQIDGYIQSIGKRLAAVSKDPNAPFKFYVLEDPAVNAFAIPGHHLYVQTGLILAADSEAEVAAVMAHEMGHAEERHPTQRLSRAYGMQMLTGLLLGENPGQLQQIAAALATTGGISAYSRSAELEADTVGVYLLNRAGYDPTALVNFFEKLADMEEQAGGRSGAAFFSTHPPTPDRIQNVNALIASFGAERAKQTQIVGGFQTVQARIRQVVGK